MADWRAIWAALVTGAGAAWTALKKVAPVALGAVLAHLRQVAEDRGKLADQYKQILEVERANHRRPVAGAAERLRRSGYNKPRQ